MEDLAEIPELYSNVQFLYTNLDHPDVVKNAAATDSWNRLHTDLYHCIIGKEPTPPRAILMRLLRDLVECSAPPVCVAAVLICLQDERQLRAALARDPRLPSHILSVGCNYTGNYRPGFLLACHEHVSESLKVFLLFPKPSKEADLVAMVTTGAPAAFTRQHYREMWPIMLVVMIGLLADGHLRFRRDAITRFWPARRTATRFLGLVMRLPWELQEQVAQRVYYAQDPYCVYRNWTPALARRFVPVVAA